MRKIFLIVMVIASLIFSTAVFAGGDAEAQ